MKRIWNFAKIAAAVLLYYLAVQSSISIRSASETAVGLLEGGALDAKTAEAIREQEAEQKTPQYFCFWGETSDIGLSCRETGKTAVVSAVLTAGNPALVVAGAEQLLWEPRGCCIDTETAVELFGTKEAAGQLLLCGDSSYVVLSTFESLRRTLVRSAFAEDGACLNMVSLRTSRADNGKSELEQFLMRYGLSGACMDFVLPSALAHNLLLLFPLILAVRVSGAFLGSFFWGSGLKEAGWEQKAMCGLWLILAAVTVVFSVYFIGRQLWIPADMIPTKWSDFSFWPTWWQQQRRNLLLLFGTAQGEAQLSAIWGMIQSAGYNLTAVLLLALTPFSWSMSRG